MAVKTAKLTLPARVKERHYDGDYKGRDAIPLLAGEGRVIICKLHEGAHEVQKVLWFQKQQGNGLAAVSVEWTAKTDTPAGPELKRILGGTGELDWPRGSRILLSYSVDDIKRLGAAQGDETLLRTREAVCKLAGWSTPQWAANQEVRHQGEMRAQKAEVGRVQRQLQELQERWRGKKADLHRCGAMTAMNDQLLKEVDAEWDEVVRLKAALRAVEERNHQLLGEAEKREYQMGRMCIALKAAESAKEAEQERWVS